jgi:hypothetical protein
MKFSFLTILITIFANQTLAKNSNIYLSKFDSTQGFFKEKLISQEASEGQKKNINFSNNFVSDLNFIDNYQTTNNKLQNKESSFISRLSTDLTIKNNFSIKSLLYFNQIQNSDLENRVNSQNSAKDRFFNNQALLIKELTVSFNRDNYSIVGGKFSSNFGSSWIWGRGISLNQISQNYQQDEKLGFGFLYKIGDLKETGLYNFSFSTFTNDRKNLDNSSFNHRDSDQKKDAVAGDTRSLKSYNASLDILFEFEENEQLSYHFSYLELAINPRNISSRVGKSTNAAVDETKTDREKGYSAAMNYRLPINKNLLLDLLVEFVDLKNINGNSDFSNQYFTANAVAEMFQNFNITAGLTNFKQIEANNFGYDQNLAEISLGYNFDKTLFFDNLLIQAGYKNLRTNNKTSISSDNSLLAMIRYIKKF